MNNVAIKMSNNDWRYLTFVLMGSRVILRSCSNPWGGEGVRCYGQILSCCSEASNYTSLRQLWIGPVGFLQYWLQTLN